MKTNQIKTQTIKAHSLINLKLNNKTSEASSICALAP